MKIVVLCAGTSTEREISIVSGTGVCKALRGLGHKAILLDVFTGLEGADPATVFDGEYDVDQAAEQISSWNSRIPELKKERRVFFGPKVLEICQAADFVFMALHGSNGEDGRVQAAFDLLGIKYSGPDYISSAISMDKARTKQVFEAEHIPTPHGCTVYRGQEIRTAAAYGLEFPLIVKPCCGGSSVGVTICHNDGELKEGLEKSFALEPGAVVEEYIEGSEYTVAVIDGKAYPVVQIAPKQGFYDYKNKYAAGATEEICPAPISPEKTQELQKEAIRAAEALGVTVYSRMDFRMRADGRIYCLEANTLPGMTPTSLVPQEAQAVGIDYAHLCQLMVDVSLKKYGQK